LSESRRGEDGHAAAPALALSQQQQEGEAGVEEAIEAVAAAELAQAGAAKEDVVASIEAITPVEGPPSVSSMFAEPASGYAYYQETFRELFSEKKVVTVTQKELTTVALEGAAGGAALMGLLLVLLRPK